MTANPDATQFGRLVTAISRLVDEIKLLNLNLTIANARLRLTDQAFKLVSTDFGTLLDTTSVAQETAAVAVKRATGEPLDSDEQKITLAEMNLHLERVKQAAENIVSTVVSLKKGNSIDQEV
jgi:hypothetical protein